MLLRAGGQQRQEKRQEGKNEEKQVLAEGEAFHFNPGKWCSYGGTRTEQKTERRTKRKKQGAGPQPNYPEPFGRLLRPVWITQWFCSINGAPMAEWLESALTVQEVSDSIPGRGGHKNLFGRRDSSDYRVP